MVVLTSEPVASIGGKISRWNAAFNPVRFTFQREATDERSNLRLQLVITSGTKTVSGLFSPDPNGKINANLFSLLKSLIKPVDTFDHTTTNYIDRNLFAAYTVKYREEWEDEDRVTQNSSYVVLPNIYYVTYTAMQLLEAYGGNMAEYLTFKGGSSAKFLTEFKQPKASEGLPYDISFILSESLLLKKVFFKYTPLDINGNEIIDGINLYYLLTEEGGKFINEENTGGMLLETSDIPALLESTILPENILPQDVGIVRIRIPEVVATAYKLRLEVFYVEGDESIQVTETKIIEVEKPCSNDPYVYLKWMNHLGAWDYYRFGYNQSSVTDVSNDQVINRVITDWANQDTIADVIKKSAIGKITVGAQGIKADHLNGLNWLKMGIKAQMLFSINPVKWQTVIVQSSAGNPISSRDKFGSIKLTIALPEANIQNQ